MRALPSVDRIIAALGDAPHPARADAARAAVDAARARVKEGEGSPSFEEVVADASVRLSAEARKSLVSVINATGVLIHTNLGRAPLGEEQLSRVSHVARGYSNLEYDLESGRRGSRYAHAALALTHLTGAEAALVVNNNAAAVLLVLSTLCAGREVVISRGELVEIGGEFRIPDVMKTSGARLVEVGTTNRTHISDYERAITPDTAAVMKVHASNFRVVGFTASVERRELARTARRREVLFVEDLGSGLLAFDEAIEWTRSEPPARSSIESGADLITFSGDKLLGGPQAGVVAGRLDLIDRIKKHPLLRALRVDKMTLAALQSTLDSYLEGRWRDLPLWRMALTPAAEVESRVRAMPNRLRTVVERGVKLEVVPVESVAGGGSAPGEGLPSWALAVEHPEVGADDLHSDLRRGDPPVVARIVEDRLLLDLRTVAPGDDAALTERLLAILSR